MQNSKPQNLDFVLGRQPTVHESAQQRRENEKNMSNSNNQQQFQQPRFDDFRQAGQTFGHNLHGDPDEFQEFGDDDSEDG